MKSIIYLDMDGVLADFVKYMIQLFGDNWKEELEKPEWGALKNHQRLYAELEPMPDALELYHGCIELVGGDKNRVQILTALPSRTNFSFGAQDKIEWAHKFISPDIRVHFGPFAKDKQYHVQHAHDVLIDDMIRNIEQWLAAGGIGVLHTSAAASLAELRANKVFQR